VFNLATQFGGGKTHALTLLYHLAKNGSKADNWNGVSKILSKSGMKTVPNAAVAVFVGMEFDSIQGRGGVNGEPVRKTPWGEIAFQLGGEEGFKLMEEHEKKMIAPAGDVIRRLLPNDKPCLILMDELMNYVSRYRKSGLAGQLYNFLQSLSETVRGEKNVVLAVSIPASELEMTAEDQADYSRFKKLLDRVGKAVVMSAETETSEIIRRRLFEWFGLPEDGRKAAAEFAEWIVDHRQQVPSWFPVDTAREAFAASYQWFFPSLNENGSCFPDSSRPEGFSGCWRCGFPGRIRPGSREPTETRSLVWEPLPWMTRCFGRRCSSSWVNTAWRGR